MTRAIDAIAKRVAQQSCICGHAAISHMQSYGLCSECQCMGFKLPKVAAICRYCARTIEPLLDPWGSQRGWHHPTLAQDKDDDDGVARMYAVMSCGDEYGTEAEPISTNDDAHVQELQNYSGVNDD